MTKRTLLMILDGWGIATDPTVSAIDQAKTPFVDSLYAKYPHSKLEASGLAVGLPEGQMGNSEVGHMNIGAGRVVYQDLVKVNKSIAEHTLNTDTTLLAAFEEAKENGKKLHFIGLVSDGGVHSHIDHLKALCRIAGRNGLSDRLFIHAFTDGRDTDPKGGAEYLTDLQGTLNNTGGTIATVVGRYYAMDRDCRWERVKRAYDVMVNAVGEKSTDLIQSVKEMYQEDITDEFMSPLVKVNASNESVATISDGDVVICFNFRTDRGRQITQALTQKEFPKEEMKPLKLHYVTLTNYDDTFKGIKVIFKKNNLEMTLGETLAKAGKTQIRVAETEKYPHVTFFFSGGNESEFEGERRILCPSPKVATYDLQPEMSAREIRDKMLPELEAKSADFICLNFANPDMVGHTGVFEAAVKACETVDSCAEAVAQKALDNGYAVIIIADHGNSDYMVNADGTPNTAHTTNLVPCILLAEGMEDLPMSDGKLADVAPTILKLMGVAQPSQMTGKSLI